MVLGKSVVMNFRREIGGDGRGTVLLVIGLGWFLSIGVRMIYPVLLPELRVTYGMGLTVGGLLITVLWLTYALGQFPAGIFADRYGEKTILTLSTLVSTGLLLVLVASGSQVVLFVATGLFGMGTSLYGIARFTAITDLYPRNDGIAMGLTMAAGDLGNALLPAVAALIAAGAGWRFGFAFTIPLFALTTVLLFRYVPNFESGDDHDGFYLNDMRVIFRHVLTTRNLLLVVVIQILINFVWQAYMAFYPTYLIEVKGLSTGAAGALFGLFFAAGVVTKPVSGAAYDRFGPRACLIVLMSTIFVSLHALIATTNLLAIVGVTLLSSSLLGYGSVTIPFLTTSMPAKLKGTGLGFLRTVYLCIGAASPVVIGAFADWQTFDRAFIALSGLVLITVILASRIDSDR